ncbi:MAG: hypothetical protein MK008_13590 [Bdellovibrionales bacterium]|nr:hypothetical protein [Bdellovibrionales bacterium]
MNKIILLFSILIPSVGFASNIETLDSVLCEEVVEVGACSEPVATANSSNSGTKYTSYSFVITKQIVEYHTVLQHLFGDDELLSTSKPYVRANEKQFSTYTYTSHVPGHRWDPNLPEERHELAKQSALAKCENLRKAHLARRDTNIRCVLEN